MYKSNFVIGAYVYWVNCLHKVKCNYSEILKLLILPYCYNPKTNTETNKTTKAKHF